MKSPWPKVHNVYHLPMDAENAEEIRWHLRFEFSVGQARPNYSMGLDETLRGEVYNFDP